MYDAALRFMYLLPVFALPQALALAPAAALAVWWSRRPATQPAAIFSSLDGLAGLPVTLAQRLRGLMPYVRGLGLVLLAVALARPQKGVQETLVNTEGIAIQAAIDISGSMEAMDFSLDGRQVTRLEAVKHVFSEFVMGNREMGLPGRKDDAIGLVAYGGFADSRCPMTLDHGALLDIVASLETPREIRDRHGRVLNRELLEEEQMTAIGDALALSLQRLKEVKAKSKAVVLLSDGVNNAGVTDPMTAAELAKKLGVKIYAIGIGESGEAPFRMMDRFGKEHLVPRRVEMDEKLLKALAAQSGGQYFHAKNTDRLRAVYAEIDKLERSETERAVYMEYHELYAWPLAAGLLLLALDAVLMATRFRGMP